MKIVDMIQGEEEWHNFRLGKITGTRLGSIWSSRAYTKDDIVKLLEERGVEFKKSATKAVLELLLTEEDKEYLSSDSAKKLEFYQILADQVAIAPADELIDGEESPYWSAMDRGTGEEDKAIAAFTEKTGKQVLTTGCFASDVDERIIMSPDGYVAPLADGIVREEVEVKHLSSAKHLMAFFERKIPEEYWTQKVQYFTVNPQCERVFWVFRDPRIPMLPVFILVVERDDVGHWPETMLKYQQRTLKEIDALRDKLLDNDEFMFHARPEKVSEV